MIVDNPFYRRKCIRKSKFRNGQEIMTDNKGVEPPKKSNAASSSVATLDPAPQNLSAVEVAARERKQTRKEEVTREHDKIIGEIEQSDQTCLGMAMKNVYTLGHVGRFQKKLDKRIRHHEREIERMCNFHYSHFVSAIEELSSIRGDAIALVKQVVDTNQSLQELGNEIKDRHRELIQCRRRQANINRVIDQLNASLPILRQFRRVQQMMAKRKFYSALKIMGQIEHTHLGQVEQFKFAQTIQRQFPLIKDEIMRTMQVELKDFLENIQVNAPKIGTAVLRKYLLKRKPDLDENHPLLNNPQQPIKRMMALPQTKTISPPSTPRDVMQSSLTESAQDLTKNPFGDDDDDEEDDRENGRDEGGTNPFGEEESSVENDDFYSDDDNPFNQQTASSNPFGVEQQQSENPFDDDDDPVHVAVYDTNPFQTDDGLDAETDVEESVFETVIKDDFNLDNDVYDFVNFSPVHKCLHIYRLLDGHQEFIALYRRERHHQARMLFEPPKDIANFPQVYRTFLHQMLGFFAIEDALINSTENLVSRQWLEQLLESGVSRVLMLLRSQLAYSDDCAELLQSKELTVAFSDALSSYGFTSGVRDLSAVLPEMWRQYIEGLLKKYAHEAEVTMLSDQLVPIQVRNGDEEAKFARFKYVKRLLKKEKSYPKTLRFSRQVIDLHVMLQKFIKNAYSYCVDVELDNVRIETSLARAVENLIQRNLRCVLEKMINERTVSMEASLQLINNLIHMHTSIKDVESYVKDTGEQRKGKKGAKARKRMTEVGQQVFLDLRRQAEHTVKPKINDRLDARMQASFDWQMKDALGKTSPYLTDSFKFLDATYDRLRQLDMSQELITEVVFATYQHIGFTLLEKLIDDKIVSITMEALQQMSLDILFCMGRVASCSTYLTSSQKSNLEMVMSESWQLVDLFIEWDWEAYFTEHGQENAKYHMVNPGMALKIMEKLRQEKKAKNMLSSLNLNKRKKIKMHDTIIKQLRALIKDWSLLTVPHRSLSKEQKDFFRN